MKKIILSLFIALFALSSCCDDKNENTVPGNDSLAPNDTTEISKSEYQVSGTVWFQKSAEARAMYLQTFSYAKSVLDNKLKKDRFKLKKKMPKAVITDIDETVLNNSSYNARLIETGTQYNSETWTKWVKEKNAKALPGALDFANYAKEKGVEVFYVSNRSVKNLEPTLENLKKEGFPYADKKHILLKEKTSDKTARRDSVLKNYDVILYLGDNLRDFSEIFKYSKSTNRNDSVDAHKDLFGTDFIVFPNPMYGEWEKAVYKGDFSKSDAEKRKMRIDALDKK